MNCDCGKEFSSEVFNEIYGKDKYQHTICCKCGGIEMEGIKEDEKIEEPMYDQDDDDEEPEEEDDVEVKE